jgi:hypothetical protein
VRSSTQPMFLLGELNETADAGAAPTRASAQTAAETGALKLKRVRRATTNRLLPAAFAFVRAECSGVRPHRSQRNDHAQRGVYVALYVPGASAVIECVRAPPSDQAPKS